MDNPPCPKTQTNSRLAGRDVSDKRCLGLVRQWKLEASVMSTPIQPLTLLVVAIAGWVRRDQQAAIVYLLEENRVLKARGSKLCPSCPKTQTNSRLARRAVSIVLDPWRAPDLGRVGGDVGDSGSPYAQGKQRPARGCHAPGWRPGSRPRAAPGPERASRLRHGSPGLDSGPLGWPLFRRCTARSVHVLLLGANVALENRD